MGSTKETRECEECGTQFNHDTNIKNGNFFLHIPLVNQLKQLLSDPILYQHLTNRNLKAVTESTVIGDITTGELYKELIRKHSMTGNDLSLTWNADGVSVFKSSKYSIWPIQCMVNELPPHLRSRNILLTGLWFGQVKPNMNTFLQPFVTECKKLEEIGFALQSESQCRKVFALICSSDSPARAIIRNTKQFNGEYGCDWCEHKGVGVNNHGGPPTRYYPQQNESAQLRTSAKQAAYGIEAGLTGKPVKGTSALVSLF